MTKTFGNVFIDDYGPDNLQIVLKGISGTTGIFPTYRAKGPNLGSTTELAAASAAAFGAPPVEGYDAKAAFYTFRDSIMRYKNNFADNFEQKELYVYDLNDQQVYKCILLDFTLDREQRRPFYYEFTISLLVYADMTTKKAYNINQLIGFWLNFVTTLSGSSTYASWFNSYIDYSVGLQGTDLPGCLREFTPFTGEEETLSLWDILQKFAAVPFYELWLDTGPRSVSISGTNVQLPSSKEYLVSRVSPFNGYVSPNGATLNFFDAISPKTITLDHLVKYDLNKSMEDVFTFYLTIPAAWDMNNLLLVATGEAVVDQARLSQYLYRPMNVQLFYTRIGTPTKSASVSPDGESQLDTTLKGYAQTLMNWYQFNDRSLSGAIVSMVPSHPENDIRIGDKIEIEGITGDFYVESVAHSWSYGGRLEANINITRGLNGIQPIDLSNKIFRTMRQGQVPSRR